MTNDISDMVRKMITEPTGTRSHEAKEELTALSEEIEQLRKENEVRKRQLNDLLTKGYTHSGNKRYYYSTRRASTPVVKMADSIIGSSLYKK
jgi:hypothetical protein